MCPRSLSSVRTEATAFTVSVFHDARIHHMRVSHDAHTETFTLPAGRTFPRLYAVILYLKVCVRVGCVWRVLMAECACLSTRIECLSVAAVSQ